MFVKDDFKACDVRALLPNLHQNVTCQTRFNRTLTSVSALFLTHFSHCVGCLWVALIITGFIWYLNIDKLKREKPGTHCMRVWDHDSSEVLRGVLSALTDKCFSIAVLTTQASSPTLLLLTFSSVKKQPYKLRLNIFPSNKP